MSASGGYLRRLATTGAAYTASSVISKLIAVALLPLYTRHLAPQDFGAAEVLLVSVIAASIIVRLGAIEALLRFYYHGGEAPEAVVRTAFASLVWTSTVGMLVVLALAEPISRGVLGTSEPGLVRIAAAGLWIFTNYELLLTLFRLDERARAYFTTTIVNVLATVALTVWLVVFLDEGARGLLVGNFAASAAVLVALLVLHRSRLSLIPDRALLRRMARFGMPTMPAELSLYSLNFIDRIAIARLAGLAEAGLYAIAVKFAQAVTVLVRGFQLAWPPLAYSITDDGEARRAYATVVSWYLAVTGFAVVGLALLARWIVRLLAAPEYFGAYEVIPLIAVAVTLYGLHLVLVVVIGRTGRTEINFPIAGVAMAVNIGLNLLLIPRHGIVGAGIALLGAYLTMIALMYVATRRLFPVPFEWRRLAQVTAIAGGLFLAGETLPTEGAGGLAARIGVWLAYPGLLVATGFLTGGERESIRRLTGGSLPEAWRRATRSAAAPPPSEGTEDAGALGRGAHLVDEVYEAETRDEDRPGG